MPVGKKTLLKVLLAVVAVFVILSGSIFALIYFQVSRLKGTIGSCELESSRFVEEIPFSYINGVIVVKARVNGSARDLEFILDTGAPTILSSAAVKELGIEDITPSFVTERSTGTLVESRFYRIDRLELGDAVFSDVGAMSMDSSMMGRLSCMAADGILGCNLAGACCMRIDYKAKKIVITDDIGRLGKVAGAFDVGFRTETQKTPIVRIVLCDSIPVDVTFDTGCNGTLRLHSPEICSRLTVDRPSRCARRIGRPAFTVKGESPPDSTVAEILFLADRVSLGDTVLTDIPLELSMGTVEGGKNLLGNRFLENFIVTLDYLNERIWFAPAAEVGFFLVEPVTGLGFGPSGGVVLVSTVYEGSQAAACGISPGDTVASINGRDVSRLSPEEECGMFRGELKFVDDGEESVSIGIVKNGKRDLFILARFDPLGR